MQHQQTEAFWKKERRRVPLTFPGALASVLARLLWRTRWCQLPPCSYRPGMQEGVVVGIEPEAMTEWGLP